MDCTPLTNAPLPAPISEPRLPAPASPQSVARLSRLEAAIRYVVGRGWMIDRHEAPSAAERPVFEARARRIRAAMGPAGETLARQSLARLAAAMRPRAFDGPPAMAELGAAEAVRVLAALPAGPLALAVDRYIAGEIGKGGFAPEAGEVAIAARSIAAAWEREAGLLERACLAIPDMRDAPAPLAPGETPEDRAARRKALAEQVRMTAQANAAALARADRRARGEADPPPPETPEDALVRLAALPPAGLSPDVLRRVRGGA